MKQISLQDIRSQEAEFLRIIKTNPNIATILKEIKFPENLDWYLVGGCVNQTIWNFTTKRDWSYGIGDYDLFYWDKDLSEEKEAKIQEDIRNQFKKLDCNFDVVNQARVHRWFRNYFGAKMPGYSNLEQAVSSPPSTITCIGVANRQGKLLVYAPYGFSDIFSMKLRYNPETFIPDKFVIPKIQKWKKKWPELEIVKKSYPKV